MTTARPDRQARVLVPIGGGCQQLSGYAQAVMKAAPGPVARIAVLPAACGVERTDSTGLAELAESVALIQQACGQAATAVPRIRQVQTVLVEAFQPGDGDRPECAAAVAEPRADGVFLLGGDQARAMRILAGSRLEQAIAAACAEGAVIGGTSAGAAVQSVTMLAGFASGADEATGLRREAADLWPRDGGRRGLIIGTGDCVIDQHFFERGRFGRLLAATARCADQGRVLLGVGLDVRTGALITRDRIGGVFGEGAVALADLSAAGARHRWAGPQATLAARDILVHVLPPGPWGYDLGARTAWHADAPVPFAAPPRAPWPAGSRGPGRLLLGGGLVGHPSGDVLAELVRSAAGPGPMLIVLRAYPAAAAAQAAADAYRAGLRQAGWPGPVEIRWPADYLPDQVVSNAAGMIAAAGDEAILAAELEAGSPLRRLASVLPAVPAVLVDDAMTAAAGAELAAVPRPHGDTGRGELASATLRPGLVPFRPALGLVPAVTEPMLTAGHRWARLLVAASRTPARRAVGICQGTALTVGARGPARVIGPSSVVAVDGRAGTYGTGGNGVLAALNVLVHCHAAGDHMDTRLGALS